MLDLSLVKRLDVLQRVAVLGAKVKELGRDYRLELARVFLSVNYIATLDRIDKL